MLGEQGQKMAATAKVVPPGEGKRLQIRTETAFIKLSGAETGGLYAVMEGWTPPGAGPGPHRHSREDETFYVLEGEYEFTVAGQAVRAPAGSLVFGARGISHSFKNIGGSTARLLVLIQPAGLERFFEQITEMLERGPVDQAKLAALAAQYGVEVEK
jgi:quercetin dioxygenase-like cupin family protein